MLGAVERTSPDGRQSENEAFRERGAVIRPRALSWAVLFSGSFENTLNSGTSSFGTPPLFKGFLHSGNTQFGLGEIFTI